MRILSVYQTYDYFGVGSQTNKIRVLAEGLQRKDHLVSILAVDYRRRFGWRHEDDGGIDTIYLGKTIRARIVTLSLDSIPFCLLELRNYDIVHIYGLYDLLGPVVAFFCRRLGVPYVLEPMGMFQPVARSIRIKKLYHSIFAPALVRGAQRVIATSEMEREELLRGGVPPAQVVFRRNGVQGPAVGIAASVLFPGPLYGEEKWEAFRDADLFVLPSQYESFGNVAMEALACGTPAVVTDRCGVAPLLGDAAIIVPHEEAAIAEAIRAILSDDELRSRMQSACRSTADAASWDGPLAEMDSMYQDIRRGWSR
ncbi:MAG: glycosyltransferase [Chloroflexi bacterium]|nr:glycosyltransferase [Chloroflexota bacterium]